MFIPNITAEGIAREIASRAIGEQATAANDLKGNLIAQVVAIVMQFDTASQN